METDPNSQAPIRVPIGWAPYLYAKDALHLLKEQVRSAEDGVKNGRDLLRNSILHMGEHLKHSAGAADRAIAHLYWGDDDVNVAWIAEAFEITEQEALI